MSKVLREERTENFTVMANYHLKDKRLSLKAKGLLSMILSLPENWIFNMRGLATLSKDGIDSTRAAMNELENYGYVVRFRNRTETGMYTEAEYIIREKPIFKSSDPEPKNTNINIGMPDDRENQ